MDQSSTSTQGLLDLTHPASGQLLRLAPAAGFAGVSWQVGGREHLHLSQPLDQFLREEHTGGLPLLYPWANRLRSDQWSFGGKRIDLDGHARVHRDGNGRPMHGLLVRWSDWETQATDGGCMAAIDWQDHEVLMAAFPFAHRLEIQWTLDSDGLEVRTSVTAGDERVPVSFGWHPYVVIPGASRGDITMHLPDVEEVPLDEDCLPVPGADRTPAGGARPLGERSWDHCFSGISDGDTVELRATAGGIQFEFLEGWRWMQIYSPDGADFACIEPMTAITAALDDQDPPGPVVDPGCTYTARFRMRSCS
ncbi:MAG: aldose 1-epimerase [Phycisphaerales bacterium]|nr:aldose 1-epimerase [Phycisphaerales bacterium]